MAKNRVLSKFMSQVFSHFFLGLLSCWLQQNANQSTSTHLRKIVLKEAGVWIFVFTGWWRFCECAKWAKFGLEFGADGVVCHFWTVSRTEIMVSNVFVGAGQGQTQFDLKAVWNLKSIFSPLKVVRALKLNWIWHFPPTTECNTHFYGKTQSKSAIFLQNLFRIQELIHVFHISRHRVCFSIKEQQEKALAIQTPMTPWRDD